MPKAKDTRPALAQACRDAQTSPVWVTAFGHRLLLGHVDACPPGPHLVVFVYHSEFGLGTLADKDGYWAHEPLWLRPGRRGRASVRIQAKDIRAVVLEQHRLGLTALARATTG